MTTQLFTFHQLKESAQSVAQSALEKEVREWIYHKDNLTDYYQAFGLPYYEDQTLDAGDIIAYCEFANSFSEWIEILNWLRGLSINLRFNLETRDIAWDDSDVTERTEKGVYQLIMFETKEDELLEYPVYEEDATFFYQHQETIFNLLDQIQREIGSVLDRIDHSLAMAYQELEYELEEGKALFDEAGNLVCVSE